MHQNQNPDQSQNLRRAAIMAGLVVSCCAVQAQSTVTVYGRLNVSLNRLQFGSTATTPSTHLSTVSSDISWLGFRGVEDLGGGLQAVFKLEHGLQLDTGAQSFAGAFWNREAYVGLSSRQWGSVQLGSFVSPEVWISARVDPMRRAGLAGDQSMLQAFPWQRGYTGLFTNTVQYITPNLAGFTGRALVAAGEGAAIGKAEAGSLEYTQGPVYAALAYQRSKVTAASAGLLGAPVTARVWSAGATYNFGVAKLHGSYLINRIPQTGDARAYMVGVSVPVSAAGELRGTYLHRTSPGATASLPAVGYLHQLSRRTSVYTNVGRLENEGRSTTVMFPATVESAANGLPKAGQNVTGVQVGVQHFF